MRQEQALVFGDQLLVLPETTDQDRRDCVRLALVLRKFEAGEPHLRRLLQSAPGGLLNLQLAAEFYFAKATRPTRFIFAGNLWPENLPTAREVFFGAGLVDGADPQPTRRRPGSTCGALAEAEDQVALDALVLLSASLLLSQSEASACWRGWAGIPWRKRSTKS